MKVRPAKGYGDLVRGSIANAATIAPAEMLHRAEAGGDGDVSTDRPVCSSSSLARSSRSSRSKRLNERAEMRREQAL